MVSRVLDDGVASRGKRMLARLALGLVVGAGLVAAAGCQTDTGYGTCGGDVLFGRPNAMTGLDDTRCQPRCHCGGRDFEPPEYTQADADALLAFELVDPPAELLTNPYVEPVPPGGAPGEVCGVLFESAGSSRYTLATYASEEAATDAGARVTHFGACGLCSSLQDLAVYMRNNDLTDPVRACGLQHFGDPPAEHVQCLVDLGFTLPCAEIWYYNTINTKEACAEPCYSALTDPYHLPDGTLNACLQCDEDISGPVFKAIAGRTRRNTGLPNAMCRPCSEVQPLVHDYR